MIFIVRFQTSRILQGIRRKKPPMSRIPGGKLKADGWEGKREVKEVVVVDGVVEMVEAVVEKRELEVVGLVEVVVEAVVDTA